MRKRYPLAAVVAATCVATAGPAPVPLGQLAAAASGGGGLSVSPDGDGARLHCAFQQLEGLATAQGLWVQSAPGPGKPFRVLATRVGDAPLPRTGTVTVTGDLVRFVRPGLVEEYSVSMDGIRQDFLVPHRPPGDGELQVSLAVDGARAWGVADRAILALDGSGRALAYGRLRAVDASGRDLPAHLRVTAPDRLTITVNDAGAVYPVRIDPTISDADWVSLNPGLQGTDGQVNALAADTNGDVYVAGAFRVAGTMLANRIVKWDGTSWRVLGSGMDGTVHALAVIGPDLYAGGAFSSAGGVTASKIARWDGARWSAMGKGIEGEVYALAGTASGLYVGGAFTAAGGVTANNLARWDGSQWSTLGAGVDSGVKALAVMGTHLYAGGYFSTAGGVPANHIAVWDGASWSALGSGMNKWVNALAVIGRDLYAGGFFWTAGGVSVSGIAKWNGTSWSGLGPGLTYFSQVGNPPQVHALATRSGTLYVGGRFDTAGGIDTANIARWDGNRWSGLGSGTGRNNEVFALAVSDEHVLAGGRFAVVDDAPVGNVVRWDGSAWSALGAPLDTRSWANVTAVAADRDRIYAAVRQFYRASVGHQEIAIERWDGSAWARLGSVTGDSLDLKAMLVDGTDLYVGGRFTAVNGVPAVGIAKWDGTSWSALGTGVDPYAEVRALALRGSELFVGGYNLHTAGGVSVNGVARWDGSRWSALGSGVDHSVSWSDGDVYGLATIGMDLYVGGYFTSAGGVPAHNVARWNGSTWSALGSGVDGTVRCLAAVGGELYAGGDIRTAGDTEVNGVARWDGRSWSAPGSGVEMLNSSHSIRVEAAVAVGSDLYVGGGFVRAGGTRVDGVARWDGTTWSALGQGVAPVAVEALATDQSDHLVVGGSFTVAGTTVSPHIVQANVAGLDFTWQPLPSPQPAGVPFPVTLTARDASSAVLTSHTSSVALSAYAPVTLATNITVETGADTWGYPLLARYHDARTQVIYPSDRIGRACTITSVALDVTAVPGQTLSNWTIRLKHTTLTRFPSSPNWEADGWDGGLQTDLEPGAPGWRPIELSAPFEYNGTDNLLVDFSFNNASYSSEGQCRATNVGVYRSITFATDSAYGDPVNWSGDTPAPLRSQMVPNLLLGATYRDTVSVSVTPTITGSFVDGVWTGAVAIAGVYSGVILRADDGLGHDGESDPFDVEAVGVADTDADGIDDAWELAHFPSLTNVSFHSDWDGDGFRDGFECAAGTDPADPGDYLGITSVEVNAAGTEAVIRWSSVSNKLYSVYGAADLISGMGELLTERLPATPPVNIYTDTVDGAVMRTYGVEVEP